jgi:hypothetical protein
MRPTAGFAIGPALGKNLPPGCGATRLPVEHVQRAEPQSPVPRTTVAASSATVTVYDLSSPLPVLRTFAAIEIRLTPSRMESPAHFAFNALSSAEF